MLNQPLLRLYLCGGYDKGGCIGIFFLKAYYIFPQHLTIKRTIHFFSEKHIVAHSFSWGKCPLRGALVHDISTGDVPNRNISPKALGVAIRQLNKWWAAKLGTWKLQVQRVSGWERCWWVVVSKLFIFTPTWGNDPFWLVFFNWVETTN